MKEKEIKVLRVAPMQFPEEVVLKNELNMLQLAVNGLVEFICLEKNVCLIHNEEGEALNLPANRTIGGKCIFGTFYICGNDYKGNLTSLSKECMEYYKKKFLK